MWIAGKPLLPMSPFVTLTGTLSLLVATLIPADQHCVNNSGEKSRGIHARPTWVCVFGKFPEIPVSSFFHRDETLLSFNAKPENTGENAVYTPVVSLERGFGCRRA